MKSDEIWWKLIKSDENRWKQWFHQISSDFISFSLVQKKQFSPDKPLRKTVFGSSTMFWGSQDCICLLSRLGFFKNSRLDLPFVMAWIFQKNLGTHICMISFWKYILMYILKIYYIYINIFSNINIYIYISILKKIYKYTSCPIPCHSIPAFFWPPKTTVAEVLFFCRLLYKRFLTNLACRFKKTGTAVDLTVQKGFWQTLTAKKSFWQTCIAQKGFWQTCHTPQTSFC